VHHASTQRSVYRKAKNTLESVRDGYSTITQGTKPLLMKTIFFTNRERIMIGEDPIEYMTYLQKKLPGANYSESHCSEEEAFTH